MNSILLEYINRAISITCVELCVSTVVDQFLINWYIITKFFRQQAEMQLQIFVPHLNVAVIIYKPVLINKPQAVVQALVGHRKMILTFILFKVPAQTLRRRSS